MANVLTTREIAALIWIFLFLYWILSRDKDGKLRASFKLVLKVLLSKWIVSTLALMSLWTVGLVLFLESLSLWSLEHLKPTFYWAVGVAAVSLFESKQAREKFSAYTMMRDHLAAIVLVQIFVSIKPLPLLGELVLVPVSSVLVVLSTFSEHKSEFSPAKKLFDTVLIAIGAGLLVWSGIGLYEDPIGFSGNLLTNVTIPLILTAGFLPFLAVFYLFLGHEYTVGVILRLEHLGRLEKVKLILRCFKVCGFELKNISLLERHMKLHRPKSSSELVTLAENLSHTFALRTSSYKPAVIAPETIGWELQPAQNCLVLSGLRPSTYEWLGFAWQGRDSIKTAVRNSDSTLTYYIAGKREVATELELLFEVFGEEIDEELFEEYVRAVFSLLTFVFGDAFDVSLKNLVEQMRSFSIEKGDKVIEFAYKEFDSPAGLEVKLVVKRELPDA